MRIFFTFILGMVLPCAHTNTAFDLTPQKAAGAAIITVVAGGILYLVKSNKDTARQIELLSQQRAEREDALQNFKNASDQALTATRKIREKLQSAKALQGGTEQDPVTYQDIEAIVNFGQAMERLLALINEIGLPKKSPDQK